MQLDFKQGVVGVNVLEIPKRYLHHELLPVLLAVHSAWHCPIVGVRFPGDSADGWTEGLGGTDEGTRGAGVCGEVQQYNKDHKKFVRINRLVLRFTVEILWILVFLSDSHSLQVDPPFSWKSGVSQPTQPSALSRLSGICPSIWTQDYAGAQSEDSFVEKARIWTIRC